jgi:hypothetical protein
MIHFQDHNPYAITPIRMFLMVSGKFSPDQWEAGVWRKNRQGASKGTALLTGFGLHGDKEFQKNHNYRQDKNHNYRQRKKKICSRNDEERLQKSRLLALLQILR